MSNAQITGGYILYSEQAQPGTFGSPKGEARFDFGVEQGADYTEIAQKAAKEARSYVRRLIGLKASELVVAVPNAPAYPPTPAAEATVTTVPAQGTKEAAAAAMNAADKPVKPKRQKPPAAEVVGDPTDAVVEPLVQATLAVAATATDEWADDATPAPVVPISDKELTDATSRKYKALGAGDATSEKIRALTKQFHGGPPKQLCHIPQERRVDYLVKLEALT